MTAQDIINSVNVRDVKSVCRDLLSINKVLWIKDGVLGYRVEWSWAGRLIAEGEIRPEDFTKWLEEKGLKPDDGNAVDLCNCVVETMEQAIEKAIGIQKPTT